MIAGYAINNYSGNYSNDDFIATTTSFDGDNIEILSILIDDFYPNVPRNVRAHWQSTFNPYRIGKPSCAQINKDLQNTSWLRHRSFHQREVYFNKANPFRIKRAD
jgi:hypothetical protein